MPIATNPEGAGAPQIWVLIQRRFKAADLRKYLTEEFKITPSDFEALSLDALGVRILARDSGIVIIGADGKPTPKITQPRLPARRIQDPVKLLTLGGPIGTYSKFGGDWASPQPSGNA